MTGHAHDQFQKEIYTFLRILGQNYLFASFAMAIGLIYIITSVLGTTPQILFLIRPPALSPVLRMITGALSLVSIGLGIGWMLVSFRMMKGISEIKTTLDEKKPAITDNELTCLIVRTLAYYRDKRSVIRMMVCICTIGGCIFLLLAIPSSIDFIRVILHGTDMTRQAVLLGLPLILVYYYIALKSLIVSYYFIRFSTTWDRRLGEIDASECTLKEKLGLDDQ